MIDKQQIKVLIQAQGHVRTFEGDKIGSFGQFYVDDDSGRPSWVTVRTGFFGSSESFVPLVDASADGSDVLVPYSKDLVKDAPRIEHDGDLSPEEADRLYRHYQLSGTGAVRPASLRRYSLTQEATAIQEDDADRGDR